MHSLLSNSIEVKAFQESHLFFYLLNRLLVSGNYWLKLYKNDRVTTSAMLSLCVTFQVNIYREYKQQGTFTYKISGCRKNIVQEGHWVSILISITWDGRTCIFSLFSQVTNEVGHLCYTDSFFFSLMCFHFFSKIAIHDFGHFSVR